MSTDFDYSQPVPFMPTIDRSRSWEPAARHYKPLTEQEKAFNAAHPLHVSQVLAETFKATQRPEDLTAWVDSQPMPGQQELPLLFCDEVNSEFRREPGHCNIHCTKPDYHTGKCS